MATQHTFSAHAALMPLLHAARYPHETVIGCLLGPAPSAEDSEHEIRYEHAIPLLHHWTGLSAAIEMAMLLVSSLAVSPKPAIATSAQVHSNSAKANKSDPCCSLQVEEHAALNEWTVRGFYFANEGLGETPNDPAKANVPILIKRLIAQAASEVAFFAVSSLILVTAYLLQLTAFYSAAAR